MPPVSLLALLGAWWFSQTSARSRTGAIVFGALSVPTRIRFFSGLPGMFGATAATLAGLTAGRAPEHGTPRVFGVVGLALAVLDVVVALAGTTIAWLT